MIDWKKMKYEDQITTDSLWITESQHNGKLIIPKREMFKDFDSSFHGLFIPEIPYQMIRRFSKEGDKIWDCFAGGGTTYYVAKKIGRENDVFLSDLTVKQNVNGSIIHFADVLNNEPLKEYKDILITAHPFKMLFFHPPYYNIINFSESTDSTQNNDLSNTSSLIDFLAKIELAIKNTTQYLQDNGTVILVCGNIWYNNEEIDLGVEIKEKFRKVGFKCRSHIIKDYGETKAKIFGQGYNLQYYRNLKNNTNFFYGDNIFILQK